MNATPQPKVAAIKSTVSQPPAPEQPVMPRNLKILTRRNIAFLVECGFISQKQYNEAVNILGLGLRRDDGRQVWI